jgi:outer membrane protein
MTRRMVRPAAVLFTILIFNGFPVAPGPLAQEPPPAPPPPAPGAIAAQQEPEGPAYVLSLHDAVKAALENNLNIMLRAYDPLRSEAQVIFAESNFDPLLNGTASSVYLNRPSASQFVTEIKTHDYVASFIDPVLTGGRYQIDFEATDNTFLAEPGSPQEFDASWRVSVTQPLLRNFGVKANKTFIVEARNTLGISQSSFRQTVIDTLSGAEEGYWDLNFALMNLKTAQAALQLAQDFLDQNRIKVRVGTLAPIEITQAEAQVADREEAVIVTANAVKTAEDVLRGIMNVPKDSPIWSQPIQPSDPLPLVEVAPDMDSSVATALARRPDMEQARLDLKSKETDLAYRKNQRRWGLNLSGQYGNIGIDSAAYRTSISDLSSGPNPNWNILLALGIPIGNRQAISRYTDAEYALSQSQKNLEATELNARVVVRNAVRAVQTTLKRVKAAQVNVRLQKEKLAAEQKKFENGMSTSFQVLQFQNDLFTAQVRENLAMVDYNKAQVELDRSEGTLLEARNLAMPDNESRRIFPYKPRTKVKGAPGGEPQPAKATSTAEWEGPATPGAGLPDDFVFDGRRLAATWTGSGSEEPAAP